MQFPVLIEHSEQLSVHYSAIPEMLTYPDGTSDRQLESSGKNTYDDLSGSSQDKQVVEDEQLKQLRAGIVEQSWHI